MRDSTFSLVTYVTTSPRQSVRFDVHTSKYRERLLLQKVTKAWYNPLTEVIEMSMSVSFQKSTRRTNIDHNNRKMSEKEKAKNSHIDFSRSSENVYLIQRDLNLSAVLSIHSLSRILGFSGT